MSEYRVQGTLSFDFEVTVFDAEDAADAERYVRDEMPLGDFASDFVKDVTDIDVFNVRKIA